MLSFIERAKVIFFCRTVHKFGCLRPDNMMLTKSTENQRKGWFCLGNEIHSRSGKNRNTLGLHPSERPIFNSPGVFRSFQWHLRMPKMQIAKSAHSVIGNGARINSDGLYIIKLNSYDGNNKWFSYFRTLSNLLVCLFHQNDLQVLNTSVTLSPLGLKGKKWCYLSISFFHNWLGQ